MASRIEYEKWLVDGGQTSKPATASRATKSRAVSSANTSAKDAFKSLFGDDA